MSRPLIIAHRGCSSRYTENTLPAIRAALRLGVDYVEVDVRETRDGEIVVYHDASLRRLHRLRASVSRKTLPELKALDPPVATLGDVLRACRGKGGVLVEIKRADPARVAALIQHYRMEQSVIVFAFDARYLHRLAATHPRIGRFGLIGRHLRPALRKLPAVAGVGLNRRLVRSPAVVRAVHQRGWKLFVWTVNDPAEIERLAAWGVDGIITDCPDVAATALVAPCGKGGFDKRERSR